MTNPVFVSAGTISRNTGGVLSPGTPAGITAGMALYLATGAFGGSSSLTTAPGGTWVNDSPNSAANQIMLFRTVAAGGDTIPSIQWSGAGYSVAIAFAFSGINPTFAPIFNTTPVSKAAEKQTTSTNVISSPSVTRTPNLNNAMCIFFGKRDKSSTSNGLVYNNPTGWNSVIAAAGGANVDVPAGSNMSCFGVWYQIQTTAASIAPNTASTGTGTADPTANNLQTNVMGYGPAAAAIIQLTRTLLGVGA